ncbi:MAG: hypothetical protein ABTR07_05865 [Candidatus Competibacter denitrificans]
MQTYDLQWGAAVFLARWRTYVIRRARRWWGRYRFCWDQSCERAD